jgi:hypothetical protein
MRQKGWLIRETQPPRFQEADRLPNKFKRRHSHLYLVSDESMNVQHLRTYVHDEIEWLELHMLLLATNFGRCSDDEPGACAMRVEPAQFVLGVCFETLCAKQLASCPEQTRACTFDYPPLALY